MKFEWGEIDEVAANSQAFLARSGASTERTINLFISGSTSWDIIRRVDMSQAGEGMTDPDARIPTDALMTNVKGLGLFLPTADCYPTILYDEANHALGLLHLGWQSTAANLAGKAVAAMTQEFGTDPAGLQVYFGPGIKKQSYRFERPSQLNDPAWQAYLHQFADGTWGVDLLGYNMHALIQAGVHEHAIESSNVDTATDPAYYSHFGSNHSGKQGPEGRFATLAMMHNL